MWVFSCYLIFFCLVFVRMTSLLEKPLAFTPATPQFGNFSGYYAQNVLIEILEPPFKARRFNKNMKVAQSWLHPSASRWYLLSFSFIICFLLLLYHKDIFEKRNVHECLQCPPHWNTWGKVSSLTLWSVSAPQLEPQLLVVPLVRIFLEMVDNFHLVSLVTSRIGITLDWLLWAFYLLEIYRILIVVCELAVAMSSSAAVVSNFKVSMAQETVEVGGGATGYWVAGGGEMAFYVA